MQNLESLRQSTRASVCLECGKCTSVCPLVKFSEYSARSLACRHIEEEFLNGKDTLRRCLTCGTCEVRCPQDIRFTDLVRGLRERAPVDPADGNCPHGGALFSLMRLMARNGTQQDRLGWLKDELKTDPKKGEVFYWTGCSMYYDAFFPEFDLSLLDGNKAAIKLMNAVGVVPVVSPAERCCGHDLLWSGDRKSFELLAEHNVQTVADSGAKTLITSCAECMRTWKIDYAPFFKGAMPRVVHISEFLAEHMSELKLKSNGLEKVTYQDPCRLGRQLGIYEPPREVLKAIPGVELTEMKRKEKTSICCSGKWSHCDRCVKQVQTDRLSEARDTGAQVLATACPKCQLHFRCAQKDPNRGKDVQIEMRDIAQLVADALE